MHPNYFWQRKENGAPRLCPDLKGHLNSEVLDEHYQTPDMKPIFHNLPEAPCCGKIELQHLYYEIELDEDAKEICTMNTSQAKIVQDVPVPSGLEEFFICCPELHRIYQISRESNFWSFFKMTYWFMEQKRAIRETNACCQKLTN